VRPQIADLKVLMPDLLIGLDFDGPIAPIIDDPRGSRPVEGAIQVMQSLLDAGAQVAIITGRDVQSVIELGGLSDIRGLVISGLYGAQLLRDGELIADDQVVGIAELRRRLPGVLVTVDKGLWVEDKGLSLVVHSRRTAQPAQTLVELRPKLDELADELDLEVHPGIFILELRAPGYDKASALDLLLKDYSPRGVLFAGDDVGDVPALRALRVWSQQHNEARAVGVAVGEVSEVRELSDMHVDHAKDLFKELAALL